ncbi:MAG: hypothetical protein AAFQ57_17790 [Cyanobacteria bacterium J06626_14]
MNAETVTAFLLSDAGMQEVRELEEHAIAQGIRDVPYRRIGKDIVPRAQLVDVFLGRST